MQKRFHKQLDYIIVIVIGFGVGNLVAVHITISTAL